MSTGNIRAVIFAIALVALSALPVFAADPSTQKLTPSSQKLGVNQDVKPFSSVAVGVIVGTLGPGVEVATPLSRRLNLRGDAGFFNYNTSVSDSGINYNGGLKLRNGRISLDYFPWAKGFHISPGVLIYNQLDINATAIFSSTSSFTLNDVDYYSSVDKPLTGAATVEFGHKVAPALTVGWGNAIPRTGRHLSFGAEIGVAYTGTPNFNLNVTGYACNQAGQASSSAYCYNVADTTNANATDFNTNLNAQKKKITDDLNYVKAYPILNLAVTYRF